MFDVTFTLKGLPVDHPLMSEAVDVALRLAPFSDIPEPIISCEAASVSFMWGADTLIVLADRYQFNGPDVAITFSDDDKLYFGAVLRFIVDRLRSYNL